MHFQLKPESEHTNQGYLYLMEKSKHFLFLFAHVDKFDLSFNRGLHSNMAKVLLYLQEAKQTIYDASVQSANTWTNCELQLTVFVTAHFSPLSIFSHQLLKK